MNVLILSSLLAVVVTVGAPPSSDQKPAGNPARINACTVLTPDVVAKVMTPVTKTKVNTAPVATPVGVNGSQCDYGVIMLQIDSLAGGRQALDTWMRNSPKDWVTVSGVGENAYFHNVRDFMAEFFVWSGSHHFGVLMDVPAGGTAEQIKPKLIELANLIIPKLK